MNILRIMTVILLLLPYTICCQDKGISSSINPGEAKIWFLGHCGFAVQTQHYFLIFDYVDEFLQNSYPQPDNPCLSNGYINPEEIKDLKVCVFTTHEHSDHFDSVIFQWENSIPDIKYFFGWQASNSEQYHYLIAPRTEWHDDDMDIYTVNSHHSGVPEVAYLVIVDSLVIYHNGDYRGDYEDDIPFLKTKAANINLVFTSCVWQEQWTYYWINREIILQFQPKAVFPMHVRVGDEGEYFGPFQEAFQRLMIDGSVILTNNTKGIAYHYKDGQITQYTAVDPKSNTVFSADDFQLWQNYPNPFNAETTIPFELNEPSNVSLKIYNINGKLIRCLRDNQHYNTGYDTMKWDGKTDSGCHVCSGIYICRIIVEKHSMFKKMLYVE